MQAEIKEIIRLLNRKNYKQAKKQFKRVASQKITEGKEEEISLYLRKYLLFLNKSEDNNRTSIFCDPLMNWCVEQGILDNEYVQQCRLLNNEMEWYVDQYKLVLEELYRFHPVVALHIIVSIFENFNLEILSRKPNNYERLFYFFYSYGMETNYESSITALNVMLKIWKESERNNRFRGKDTNLPYVAELGSKFMERMYPIIRSLNYLHWICDELALHHMKMIMEEKQVTFIYKDIEEYKRFRLPILRKHARMQNAHRTLPKVSENRFSWAKEKIDYDRIIQVKPSGNDFKLNISSSTFMEAFKRAMEESYQNYLLILDDTYITTLEKQEVRGINCFEMFIFYYCLKILALLYYEATQHFRDKYQKEVMAPYLAISVKGIADVFIPIMSKIFKREVSKCDIEKLINLYTFGNDELFDLYCKPLVTNTGTVMIIPSLFMMNNFSKTFIYHLNRLGIRLSDRGDIFEEVTRKRFEEYGFNVYPKRFHYSYEYEGETDRGDIDLIARKGSYLFLGQLKNRIEPMEPWDHLNVDSKIKKGVYQAEKAVTYIKRNPKDFCERLGINERELATLNIQPFVLLSCFYGSGTKIKGIPVIDTSALQKFFDGELRVYKGEEIILCKSIRQKGEVLPEEFVNFLEDPYFLKENVYGAYLLTSHFYYIRERKFVVRPEGNFEDQFSNNFVAATISRFWE
ncbi:hypothetical protein [Anoxybacillus sp. EFIL]|uniref:hypothetical protein n=1 Tax=Anoxybacillus sp. EFIL TaxID=2508869 RepID=UPI00148BE47F|nr:hypothetical protein [Anoxybacillus sp. EFIL]NNU96286.1 hypothetical protein [Anoxybacillus sp. EFIL]